MSRSAGPGFDQRRPARSRSPRPAEQPAERPRRQRGPLPGGRGLAEDPEKGYAYAQAAKRLAARVGVVREAGGIAAYKTGRWAEALSELRAARRMTGHDDYIPLMADSERAMGRLDRALALVREAKPEGLSRAMQIELHIVESGIRRDQGLAMPRSWPCRSPS